MGNVIYLHNRNVRYASTEQLKREWDLWFHSDAEEVESDFHYEQIHAELNRRGEGEYCAV